MLDEPPAAQCSIWRATQPPHARPLLWRRTPASALASTACIAPCSTPSRVHGASSHGIVGHLNAHVATLAPVWAEAIPHQQVRVGGADAGAGVVAHNDLAVGGWGRGNAAGRAGDQPDGLSSRHTAHAGRGQAALRGMPCAAGQAPWLGQPGSPLRGPSCRWGIHRPGRCRRRRTGRRPARPRCSAPRGPAAPPAAQRAQRGGAGCAMAPSQCKHGRAAPPQRACHGTPPTTPHHQLPSPPA